jgi:undecaprenyl-diphosphatase
VATISGFDPTAFPDDGSPQLETEGMENWNAELFLALNASDAPDPWVLAFAKLMATSPVVLAMAIFVALWIWGAPERRGGLLTVTVALLVAFVFSLAISVAWYHPRPFVMGIGHTLVHHVPETSFPSDHATLLWTLGLGLIVSGASSRWGGILSALGLATAWSRVYLGIHFPFDMVGSLAVAGVSVLLASTLRVWVASRMLPAVDRLYERTLQVLHLPPTIFPRRGL